MLGSVGFRVLLDQAGGPWRALRVPRCGMWGFRFLRLRGIGGVWRCRLFVAQFRGVGSYFVLIAWPRLPDTITVLLHVPSQEDVVYNALSFSILAVVQSR